MDDTGSIADVLFGLVPEKGMTTLAAPRSLKTSVMSVDHAQLMMRCIIVALGARYKVTPSAIKAQPKVLMNLLSKPSPREQSLHISFVLFVSILA